LKAEASSLGTRALVVGGVVDDAGSQVLPYECYFAGIVDDHLHRAAGPRPECNLLDLVLLWWWVLPFEVVQHDLSFI
jgi:hypothetical protein